MMGVEAEISSIAKYSLGNSRFSYFWKAKIEAIIVPTIKAIEPRMMQKTVQGFILVVEGVGGGFCVQFAQPVEGLYH